MYIQRTKNQQCTRVKSTSQTLTICHTSQLQKLTGVIGREDEMSVCFPTKCFEDLCTSFTLFNEPLACSILGDLDGGLITDGNGGRDAIDIPLKLACEGVLLSSSVQTGGTPRGDILDDIT